MKASRFLNTIAAGMAMTLLGGAAASADGLTVQQRVEAEMNKGKDYAAAWQAATRDDPPYYTQELIARLKKAAEQMSQGKGYLEAWAATREATGSSSSPEQIARAKRVEQAMNAGKDYVAAWEAAQRAQPKDGADTRTAGTTRTIK